jgi:hypothetical protein
MSLIASLVVPDQLLALIQVGMWFPVRIKALIVQATLLSVH